MKSSIIPEGELLSYGFCEYGTEDDQDRHVARNDLLVEELAPNEGMSFGAAIALMKKGKKVARKGWNGKGMYVWVMPGSTIKNCQNISDPHLADIDKAEGEIRFLGSIRMRTATGDVLTGWLASQTDMLAEDWIVVE